MKVTIADVAGPHDVLIEVTDPNRPGDQRATFSSSGLMFERVQQELRRYILRDLRESLRQTLTTRLGIEAGKQTPTCDEHAAMCKPEDIVLVITPALVTSIADELARNATQSLIGAVALIEEV